MERKKSEKKQLIFVIVISLYSLSGFSQIKSNSVNYDSLITKTSASFFKTYSSTASIDTVYFNYQKEKDPAFCIAEKGQRFNKTDLREKGLCNRRIVFYGKNSNSNIRVLLYETDHGGGVGKSCDIYLIVNKRIRRLITLDVSNKITDLIKLKNCLINREFLVQNSVSL
ncbi:MAG TPA: hypothetical protein VGM41_00845 [Chitinophagaceae bacterium]|jgi:hypothetical protein